MAVKAGTVASGKSLAGDARNLRSPILAALREACVTMLAATLTLACAQPIAPGTGSAVLAVVLCLSLSRSQLDRDAHGRIEAAIVLPLVGLAAIGVGLLLQRMPWVGACVFVAGMFVSIWLRRFGPMARRAGSLIALPLVVLLTTPHVEAPAGGRVPAWLAPILIALLALLWVSVLHAIARAARWLPAPAGAAAVTVGARSVGTLRPIASTRMAVQMALALALAFVVGYTFFAERWAWIVLTAFIVLSGNRGRLDVAYKSVLRVLGAAAGTLLAVSIDAHVGAHTASTVALVLCAVFLGVWLRPLGYAWWALFVTIALALLQGFDSAPVSALLWPRLEEIVIGAIIGVASAWFVLPVRSTGVLRRRIADALAALSDALDPAIAVRSSTAFVDAMAGVQQMAPAFRASRVVTRRFREVQPADWIDALLACRTPSLALIERGETPSSVRRTVGAARKAMREPVQISPALRELHHALTAA